MIISCLKDKIDKISVECEDQITAILEQEVDNYLLDPLLNKFCENDIEVLCGNEPDDMVCFISQCSLNTYQLALYIFFTGGGGGGGQPKFLGKLGLEIGVYQKAPPKGGSFGEVLESLHLLRSAQRPRP